MQVWPQGSGSKLPPWQPLLRLEPGVDAAQELDDKHQAVYTGTTHPHASIKGGKRRSDSSEQGAGGHPSIQGGYKERERINGDAQRERGCAVVNGDDGNETVGCEGGREENCGVQSASIPAQPLPERLIVNSAFECQYCGQGFVTYMQFKAHMVTHKHQRVGT